MLITLRSHLSEQWKLIDSQWNTIDAFKMICFAFYHPYPYIAKRFDIIKNLKNKVATVSQNIKRI